MNAVASALGRQLARPRGLGGRVVAQAMRLANRRPTALAIAALDVRAGDAVLDLGCGPGDAIAALQAAAAGGAVHGVDHAEEMIALAQHQNPEARFSVADFDALPFPNARFDRILATNVAYFWQDDHAVLAELARIVRPGGRIAVYVTEAAALRRIGLHETGTHRLFTPDQFREMLGSTATIRAVDAGFGVRGLIGTIDR